MRFGSEAALKSATNRSALAAEGPNKDLRRTCGPSILYVAKTANYTPASQTISNAVYKNTTQVMVADSQDFVGQYR